MAPGSCGHKVEVAGCGWIENGEDSFRSGAAYRAGRQTAVQVGVVGRVDSKIFVIELPARPGEGVLYGGVGLERHVLLEPVKVDACHQGLFAIKRGFSLNN